jgi:uncharacterized protein YciI
MLFAIICKDRECVDGIRESVKEEHMRFLAENREFYKLVGPLMDDHGNSIGGLAVVDLADLKSVNELVSRDPMVVADVFVSVDIVPWKAMIVNL